MPQLPQDRVEAVDSTESTGGGLMEVGQYVFELTEVRDTKDGQPRKSAKGPFWSWIWKVPEDQPRYKKWVQCDNTWLHVDWQMNRPFAAFGTTSATHTDSLIGKRALLTIDKRANSETGAPENYIRAIDPYEGEQGSATGKGTEAKANLF